MTGETLLAPVQVQPVLSADPKLISLGCLLSSAAKECPFGHSLEA